MSTSRDFGLSAYQVSKNLTSRKADNELNAKCQIYRLRTDREISVAFDSGVASLRNVGGNAGDFIATVNKRTILNPIRPRAF